MNDAALAFAPSRFTFCSMPEARPRLLSASGTIDLPLARTAKILISGHSSIRALQQVLTPLLDDFLGSYLESESWSQSRKKK